MLVLVECILGGFLALVGACIFSFLNVVIYRVPRGLSFIKGFSACPDCGHRLYAWDMVPVFSWLFLRGTCRYCGNKVSVRYTIIELLGAVIAYLVMWKYGWSLQALTIFWFFCILTVVAFVDMDTMEIPNGFVIAVLLIGLISIGTMPGLTWLQRLIGFFVVSVPMLLITMVIPGAFGGGDIKLMAACGILLGYKLSLVSMMFAVFIGGIYGIWLLASKQKSRKEHFAFGPFLCLGMLVALFWGEGVMNWYLGLYGL